MNVGTNRERAIAQAVANAALTKKPRFLHRYGRIYWLESNPPDSKSPWAGACGSDYLVVFPEGDYYKYDPQKGIADVAAQRPADQRGDQERHDQDQAVRS